MSELPEADRGEIMVGIVQHPSTGLWQSWVSLHGMDVTFLSAHHDKNDATQVAQNYANAWRLGKLKSREFKLGFIAALPKDSDPLPLPPQSLDQLGNLIKTNSRSEVSDIVASLVKIIKHYVDNPIPLDAYGRALHSPDYDLGHLAAWLRLGNEFLWNYLDSETKLAVKELYHQTNSFDQSGPPPV